MKRGLPDCPRIRARWKSRHAIGAGQRIRHGCDADGASVRDRGTRRAAQTRVVVRVVRFTAVAMGDTDEIQAMIPFLPV